MHIFTVFLIDRFFLTLNSLESRHTITRNFIVAQCSLFFLKTEPPLHSYSLRSRSNDHGLSQNQRMPTRRTALRTLVLCKKPGPGSQPASGDT